MGKASSSKKVARAARAAGRPGAGRNLGWPALVSAVVVIGLVLIVVSRGKTGDALPPLLGDHWHAAYAIYDCDRFVPPLSDQIQDTSGLHTHDDSLMHLHPFGTRYTGKGASIGNWGITTGLEVTDTSLKAAGIDRENGDLCGGKPGEVKLMVWDSPSDTTGRLVDENLAAYAPPEFSLLTLAFVAEGTEIPKPTDEAIAALQAPSDVTGQPSPTISVPPSEVPSTTAPTGSTATTGPDGTTPTSEPSTTVATTAP